MADTGGEFNPQRNLSRRDFLKLTRAAVGGAAAGVALTELNRTTNFIQKGWDFLRNITKEHLNPIPNNVLIVDFAPEKQTDNFIQSIFPLNEKLERDLLGPDYMSDADILRVYGLDLIGTMGDRQETFKKLFEKNPKIAVAMAMRDDFSHHGESVGITLLSALSKFKLTVSPVIHPLQELIGNFGFATDDLGNFGFLGEIDADRVIGILKQYPDQDIVNFSWQFGKVGFFYQEKIRNLYKAVDTNNVTYNTYTTERGEFYAVYVGDANNNSVIVKDGKVFTEDKNGVLTEASTSMDEAIDKAFDQIKNQATITQLQEPNIQIVDGYNRQAAESNLPILFKTCKAFPNKLIVAAAGNVDDDLRKAREKLKDEWPENLILVGEWNPDDPTPNNTENVVLRSQVYGADLYVDNSAWGELSGSSFSTAVVSAISSAIKSRKKLSITQVKQELLQNLSDGRTYRALKPLLIGLDNNQPARVLNFDKVQSFLR